MWLAVVVAGACGGTDRPAARGPEAETEPAPPSSEAHPAAPPTLAETVRAKLTAIAPAWTFDIEGDLTLRGTSGEQTLVFNLDNLAAACAQVPADCGATIDEYVKIFNTYIVASEQPSEFTRAQIVAEPKAQAWVRAVRQGGASAEPVMIRWLGDLWIAYMFDTPTMRKGVLRSELAEYGIASDEELHALAMANLGRLAPLRPGEPVEGIPGVYVVSVGDHFESARVLRHADWAPIADSVGGELFVTIPARHVVLYAGAEHLTALAALTQQVAEHEHHAVSTTMLHWRPDGWHLAP